MILLSGSVAVDTQNSHIAEIFGGSFEAAANGQVQHCLLLVYPAEIKLLLLATPEFGLE
jgi:hypothetical protein